MTTVATDGVTMAAEGCVTGNGLVHGFDQKKVFQLEDGRVVGITGVLYDIGEFLRWLRAGQVGEPMLSDDFEGLVLTQPGECWSYNCKGLSARQSVPAVAGSGGALALGAMLAGADPVRAVEIAMERDTSSGGLICSEKIVQRPRMVG